MILFASILLKIIESMFMRDIIMQVFLYFFYFLNQGNAGLKKLIMTCSFLLYIEAYLRDIVSSVPDHFNKANIGIK